MLKLGCKIERETNSFTIFHRTLENYMISVEVGRTRDMTSICKFFRESNAEIFVHAQQIVRQCRPFSAERKWKIAVPRKRHT